MAKLTPPIPPPASCPAPWVDDTCKVVGHVLARVLGASSVVVGILYLCVDVLPSLAMRADVGADHVRAGFPAAPVVTVFRDAEHAVTCWTTGTAMACLRDDHAEDWHEAPGDRCP